MFWNFRKIVYENHVTRVRDKNNLCHVILVNDFKNFSIFKIYIKKKWEKIKKKWEKNNEKKWKKVKKKWENKNEKSVKIVWYKDHKIF